MFQWDYVCDAKTGLTASVQMGLMFGQGFGAFVITIIGESVHTGMRIKILLLSGLLDRVLSTHMFIHRLK